jgi:hypothetical protein
MNNCWKKTSTIDNFYYINIETGQSQWGIPIDPNEPQLAKGWEKHISKKIQPGKTYYRHIPSLLTQWDLPIGSPEKIIQPPLGWETHKTKCGNIYYVNIKDNTSQWTIPISESLNSKGPRGLKWTGNSCYLDSTLFAFFAGPDDFISNFLNAKNLDNYKDDLFRINNICGDDENDLKNRKAFQSELRKIAYSIWRQGPKVEFCTNLRKTLKNCPGEDEDPYWNDGTADQKTIPDKFSKDGTADSGEFLGHLLNIIPHVPAIKKTITYVTNEKGEDLNKEKLLNEGKMFISSEVYDEKASIIHFFGQFEVMGFPEYGVVISQLLNIKDDSGSEINIKYRPDDMGGRTFRRRISEKTIVNTPYFILSLRRYNADESIQGENTSYEVIQTPVFPDDFITIGDKKFEFCAVVMHDGGAHYTSVAKYGDFWYYYNDLDLPVKKYNTFSEIVEDSLDGDKNMLNPITHGTQYYYKPISR